MANTFSGLAQTGAWGCFDEFNRIPVDVLSVAAGQYGAVLDAIRSGKQHFLFEEEEIQLRPTVGAFITMNPGYAGRTELPENLKALFRGCAMVVPDFEVNVQMARPSNACPALGCSRSAGVALPLCWQDGIQMLAHS